VNLLLNLISLIGIVVLCFVAWLGSENRRIIQWNVLIVGITLQLLVGILVFGGGDYLIAGLNNIINPSWMPLKPGPSFCLGEPRPYWRWIPTRRRARGRLGAGLPERWGILLLLFPAIASARIA
jgi:CNT family concentrative nucleoside transporter